MLRQMDGVIKIIHVPSYKFFDDYSGYSKFLKIKQRLLWNLMPWFPVLNVLFQCNILLEHRTTIYRETENGLRKCSFFVVIQIWWTIHFALIWFPAVLSVKFCTCHDSMTVVPWTKLSSDHLNKVERMFHPFELAWKSRYPDGPGQHVDQSVQVAEINSQ